MNDERTDFGAYLRAARESSGVSLKQIADSTKLSAITLGALEKGQVSRLPGGIYRRSIVRAYAGEVGLDPEETLRLFLVQYPDDLPPPMATGNARITEAPDAGATRRGLVQVAVKLLGAAVPVVAGFFYFAGGPSPLPLPRMAEDSARLRPTDVWRPEIVPAGGFSEAPPPAVHPVVVRLTVSAPCVLRVTADGRLIVARQVDEGERFEIELSDEVLLSTDDAAAVQFSINGQAGRLLGLPGEPTDVRIGRRDYDLWLH